MVGRGARYNGVYPRVGGGNFHPLLPPLAAGVYPRVGGGNITCRM